MQRNPKPLTKPTARLNAWRMSTSRHLRGWLRRPEHNIHQHFLQGAAYKLGTGAVSVLIIWIQSRY